jgi:hypothetical protein
VILLLTRGRVDALAAELLEADAAGDAERLAQLGWELPGAAGAEHADAVRLRAELHAIVTAAPPRLRERSW